MWTNLNPFCYETLLLNCYNSPFNLPFVFPSYQPCIINNPFAQSQQYLGSAQKSYRETVQEIEQKGEQKTQKSKKKKVQKSRQNIKKEKEDNFERKKQKKDRNLPSNICKYFVSYLYRHPCPESILKNENSPETPHNIKTCIQLMKNHIRENQTYIRPSLIESMCRTSLLGDQGAKTLRILFKRFMGREFRLIVSMLRKLTKKEKIAYFRLARKYIKKFTILK